MVTLQKLGQKNKRSAMAAKLFRVPLISAYNSRVSAANASDSTSGYVGVGIVGLMIVGKTNQATTKDARYINCFAQTVPDPITGKKRIYCVKRPGFGTQSTPASGKKGYAILVWTGSSSSVISAFNNPSTIYSGTSSLGAITGKCTGITETFIGTTATLAVTSDDNTGWYYDSGVGTMTKITSGNFPGNIAGKTITGTFAHLDGFAIIGTTDGTVYASDLNSLTAWTANSSDSSSAYPDGGVAIVRHGQFILSFGTESIQFYYNAGLSPFPLAKANAKTVKVGAVSADAIAQISDTIFWAGSTPQGGLSIFTYDNVVQRISTPEIDAELILAGATNVTLTTIRFYGRSFVLVLAGPTTFAYCIEEKMWHEWNSTTPLWYKCAGLSLSGTMVNYAVSNVDTSGKVFLMNHASLVFTDNTAAYTARVQLPVMDLGTIRKKFWAQAEIIGDIEVSTSTITLAYSDDDFATYQTWGTLDLVNERRQAARLGSSRRRGWVLTHAAATPMRLEALEITAEIGNN